MAPAGQPDCTIGELPRVSGSSSLQMACNTACLLHTGVSGSSCTCQRTLNVASQGLIIAFMGYTSDAVHCLSVCATSSIFFCIIRLTNTMCQAHCIEAKKDCSDTV